MGFAMRGIIMNQLLQVGFSVLVFNQILFCAANTVSQEESDITMAMNQFVSYANADWRSMWNTFETTLISDQINRDVNVAALRRLIGNGQMRENQPALVARAILLLGKMQAIDAAPDIADLLFYDANTGKNIQHSVAECHKRGPKVYALTCCPSPGVLGKMGEVALPFVLQKIQSFTNDIVVVTGENEQNSEMNLRFFMAYIAVSGDELSPEVRERIIQERIDELSNQNQNQNWILEKFKQFIQSYEKANRTPAVVPTQGR